MRLIDLDDYNHTFCGYDGEYEKWNIDPDVTVPINPEPKKGKWRRISADKYVQHATAFYRRSECGLDSIGEANFCPNCGASMSEGEGDEIN